MKLEFKGESLTFRTKEGVLYRQVNLADIQARIDNPGLNQSKPIHQIVIWDFVSKVKDLGKAVFIESIEDGSVHLEQNGWLHIFPVISMTKPITSTDVFGYFVEA